jgi:ketosteroid isomerase-like protein
MLVPALILVASAADPAAVTAADGEWRAALQGRNRVALEKLVAPEYTLTTAAGVTARGPWLESAFRWQTKALEWREPPHVDVFGDAAVVRGTLHWHVIKDKPDARTGSAEMDQDFLVTDVWVRRGGQWQVVARHSTIPLKR